MSSPTILLNSHSTTSTDTGISIPCGVIHSFDETTIVNAPIQLLWHTIVHVNNNGWNWNDRLRFEMEEEGTPQQGSVGKFYIYRGKGRWRVKRCVFRQVDRVHRVLEWVAHHRRAMQRVHKIHLTVVDNNTTSLHHTETVERTLPKWWLFLSRQGKKDNTVKQVHHNAILRMNQSLKHHVESIHFNRLVMTYSTRQFTLGDSKASTTISDDSTAALSASYWDSPPHLRKQIVACYLKKDQTAAENDNSNGDANNNDDDDEGSLQGIDGLPF